MVREVNGFYYFDDDTSINDMVSFEEPIVSFNDSLIHYNVQPGNKTNTVQVDRQADLIFKKGDYLHTYITIDSTSIPSGVKFKLTDENGKQLYSPFTPDGDYRKWECIITTDEIDVIPLPANYMDNLNTWVDFEPGFYDWQLRSLDTDYYAETIIDIRVEIRGFEVWEPIYNNIYAGESVTYQLRTYADIIPYTTNYLTPNATYDNKDGIITFPPSDIESSYGEHYQQVGNRFIYYVINENRNYLINLTMDDNGDLEYTTEKESELNIIDIIDDIQIEDNDIVTLITDDLYGVTGLSLDNNGDLIFNIIDVGETDG